MLYRSLLLLVVLGGCGEQASPQSETRLFATVAAYLPSRISEYYDDGRFETFDVVKLDLRKPTATGEQSLEIAVNPAYFPPDSPFRLPGTCCSFEVDLEDLQASVLGWAALQDMRLESP